MGTAIDNLGVMRCLAAQQAALDLPLRTATNVIIAICVLLGLICQVEE